MSTNAVDWANLLNLKFQQGAVHLSLGPVLLVLIIIAAVGVMIWRRAKGSRFQSYEPVEATLKVANIGEVKLRPNNENVRVAHHAWVELTTRKVALPFDEEHDVIADVYSSFYEVFGRLRELAKSIPAHRLRECHDTEQLVDIMVRVLNQGLRPHLTVWQSKFRRWYAMQLEDSANRDLTPQQIQRKFPGYEALIKDLRKVHDDVVEYANFLRKVAQGKDT